MSDNVVPWPGPRPEEADEPSGRSAGRAPGWLDVDDLLATLPERFRDPASHLAASLSRAVSPGPDYPADGPEDAPWCADLEPEEAWAVAESFRRALRSDEQRDSAASRRAGSGVDTAALHAALDKALLQAALVAQDRVSHSHRRVLEDVSHDLRSPLNSILFLADALRAERGGPLTENQQRQVSVLYTAAVTLVKMVNDLIDFARLGEREKIRVAETSFSVESVLSDVRGLLGPLVSHREIALRVDVTTEGLRSGDPQLLSRVLLNLVSNAVQAVDERGTVVVRVDEAENGELRIEISDDRIGTDVGHLRSLISEAEAGRLPGETRGWTHGLGLSICARLVKVAGGRIQVAGRTGEGTVFSVELPFQRL